MKHQWTIDATGSGERLDVFVTSQLEEKTRSAVAKLLKNGAGTVNGKKATVHQFLKTGDVVEFNDAVGAPLAGALPGQSGRAGTRPAPTTLPPLQILKETDDWLVLNKPAGLLVHPDHEHPSGTLIDLLVAHHPPMAKIGEDPSRPGIMHRLDRDVTGLMVIAKTQSAFDDLKRQFAEHSVDKEYLALVHGELSHDEGDIKFRIARSKSKARMAARPEGEKEGKAAWTHYKVVKRFRGATLVELKILSGRTHQIRAHMHGLGHPVIGDTLYVLRQTDRNVDSPRLLLQSTSLSFTDPATGEREHFTVPPDPAFDAMMKTFKKHIPTTTPDTSV